MLRRKLKLASVSKIINSTNAESSSATTANESDFEPPRKKAPLDESFSNSAVSQPSIGDKYLEIVSNLNKPLSELTFNASIAYIYNPLEYAFNIHSNFVKKYCTGPKPVLFVGMNPGPWGMCQSGVPFGEIDKVKNWLQINGEVSKPKIECPGKEVTGLQCSKSEVSGKRLWGLFAKICTTPENFFRSAFIYNYCPLAFMSKTGTNVTPSEIKGSTQKELEYICDKALFEVIQLLNSQLVIGVGRYAEKRALEALKNNNPNNTKVVFLTHPSPRVKGNEKWMENTEKFLKDSGYISYFNGH